MITHNASENTLKELQRIYSLPAMSSVMMEVTRLLDDPSTTTADLSRLIGRDQGLSSKVLSIANSPLYGLPRKVSTIDFAIMIIGFQDVKNIVVALSMIEAFKEKDDKDLAGKDFWMHSLLTGNGAKRISDDLGFKISGEAFIAGLLHDLGIVVAYKYFKTEFNKVVQLAKNDGIPFFEAELAVFGLTHNEMGFNLGEKWNLPPQLCEAVLNHHQPSKTTNNEVLISIVHLTDYMLHHFKIGNYFWDDGIKLDEKILDVLNFKDMKELTAFMEGYIPLFEEEIKTLRI